MAKVRRFLRTIVYVPSLGYSSYITMNTVQNIQEVVAKYYNISLADLLGVKRSPEFSHPRMMAMYLCRAYLHMSFPAIGRHFHRDHTTAMHAVLKILSHPKFKDDMKKLDEKFGG